MTPQIGGARFLSVAKGCCPGEDVRSPSNFRSAVFGNSDVTI